MCTYDWGGTGWLEANRLRACNVLSRGGNSRMVALPGPYFCRICATRSSFLYLYWEKRSAQYNTRAPGAKWNVMQLSHEFVQFTSFHCVHARLDYFGLIGWRSRGTRLDLGVSKFPVTIAALQRRYLERGTWWGTSRAVFHWQKQTNGSGFGSTTELARILMDARSRL